MNDQSRNNRFSELIAQHQSAIYAYLFAIVQDWEDANDLYQTTCLILWRKFDSFQPGTSFFSWAREVAKIEARNFLKRRKPSVSVSDELVDALTDMTVDVPGDDNESSLVALQRCRKKLSDADQELLQLRYMEDLDTHDIAERLERLQSNVCRSLNRIRRALLQCIKVELAQQDHFRK
jgi:RNA polymerase sigma-70 factor (ECF subfamily)